MIKKLFGNTDDAQFRFLCPRVIAFLIGFFLWIGGYALRGLVGSSVERVGSTIFIVSALIFGWCIMKAVFGYATVAALFSNNVVIGILIFLIFLFVGCYVGVVVGIIGLYRFIILWIKRMQKKSK